MGMVHFGGRRERENTDSAERSPTKQVNDDESNTLAE